jgi:hypothetical protein
MRFYIRCNPYEEVSWGAWVSRLIMHKTSKTYIQPKYIFQHIAYNNKEGLYGELLVFEVIQREYMYIVREGLAMAWESFCYAKKSRI